MSPDLGDRTNHCRRLLGRGCGLKFGGKHVFPTERITRTRIGTATTPVNSSKTASLEASSKPEDKEKGSEENKQFHPGGKGEKPSPWKAAVMVLFYFLGETLGHGWPAAYGSCFVLSVLFCFVSY